MMQKLGWAILKFNEVYWQKLQVAKAVLFEYPVTTGDLLSLRAQPWQNNV